MRKQGAWVLPVIQYIHCSRLLSIVLEKPQGTIAEEKTSTNIVFERSGIAFSIVLKNWISYS